MKKQFLLCTLIICFISSHATTVSVSDAQAIALNFFKLTTNQSPTATLRYTKTGANNVVDFYVFDMSPAIGFVIVAADDDIIPILAYSTESSFNTNFRHTGLNQWINTTGSTISMALQHHVVADARIQGLWSSYRSGQSPSNQRSGGAVAPMCSTAWSQENDFSNPPPFIYNLFCPYNSADSERAVTGCVATAMAQIMKRWDYPPHGTGSYAYEDDTLNYYSNNYGLQSSDFAAHAYQWSQMPSALNNSSTLTQDTAVSLLMYDCAVSVGMDFGDDNQDGSGANGLLGEELQQVGDSICSQTAFVWYFGYDADTIQGIYRPYFSDSVWISTIKHEMDMGRPVLYEGNDTIDTDGGGHAWVCDGYDVNSNLHMNWGWDGASDGYYAIGNFYTLGSGSAFNPNSAEDALIGILPSVTHKIISGIKTVSSTSTFTIFPNPANGQIVLQTDGPAEGSAWEFKNIVGQTVLAGNITSTQTTINISPLSSGIYIVELHNGGQTTAKKLVISR